MKRRTILYLPVLTLLVISCQSKQDPLAVDMGLSVKWAICNIGATAPEDLGDYYAWGEVITKPAYNKSTYTLYNAREDTLTQYCYDSQHGIVDNKFELEANNDVVQQRLGKRWHIPTRKDWEDLLDTNNCTWTWYHKNTRKGYWVTSKKTGNSIFFPAAGKHDDEDIAHIDAEGYYWSSSLSFGWRGPRDGDCVYFDPYHSRLISESRHYGLSVRPVKGRVSRQAKRNIIANEEIQNKIIQAQKAQTMKAIDMGLSVKWASCNIGASKPEEYGDYYAWGEVATKSNYANWSTYSLCNASYSTMTKYCTNSSYGAVDGKATLEPEDDVSSVILSGKWRTPTHCEWIELENHCDWTWTTLNGVNGRLGTSKITGNSIFLPAAGYYDDKLYDTGECGLYWTSTIYSLEPHMAWRIGFNSSALQGSRFFRSLGQSIRPVLEE